MNSRTLYAGDGTVRLFAVPFPYISRNDVRVYLNRLPLNRPHDWDFTVDGAVELRVAPGLNDALEVVRMTTETHALVQFQNGSVLTEQELNLAMLQMLYLLQETRDAYADSLGAGLRRIAGSSGVLGATAEDIINNAVQEVLDHELTAHLQTRITDIDTNAQTILAQRIRLDTLEDVVDALANVDGQSIATFLLDEQQARIDGDNALAQSLSLIGAKSGDGLSWILDLAKVMVSPTEALGTRLQAISTSLGNNAAAIATEQTTRANADSALSSQITNVLATANNNTALITTEQTARANADSALGTRIDGMLADVNGNRALILEEQIVRANADSSLSQTIQTVQSQTNNNTASIQTQQTTINGLSAQYSVKLDVNGHVAGFGLWNQGGSSSFTIAADKFALVTPGQNPVVPFAADANGVYMPNAFIRNLTVDKVIGGNIGSQWNINNTAGRIVLDTGTHMKVLGVGFGAQGNLISWFGPKMAINLCSTSNSISHETTGGDSYHGGSLSAGVFKNAAKSTQLSQTAFVETGSFWSNGGARTVVGSFLFEHDGWLPGNQAGTFPRSLSVNLTIVGHGTVTVTGQYTASYEPEMGITNVTASFSGSITRTDNSGGTSASYRAELSGATGQWPISLNGQVLKQTLSIISTEV